MDGVRMNVKIIGVKDVLSRLEKISESPSQLIKDVGDEMVKNLGIASPRSEMPRTTPMAESWFVRDYGRNQVAISNWAEHAIYPWRGTTGPIYPTSARRLKVDLVGGKRIYPEKVMGQTAQGERIIQMAHDLTEPSLQNKITKIIMQSGR